MPETPLHITRWAAGYVCKKFDLRTQEQTGTLCGLKAEHPNAFEAIDYNEIYWNLLQRLPTCPECAVRLDEMLQGVENPRIAPRKPKHSPFEGI